MGVPTLTIAGTTPAGYYGAGINGHLGLPSFVAADVAEFVQKGMYWSSHLDELVLVRASMRERFSDCQVGKPELIATAFANALRNMWRRWCTGLPAISLEVQQQP